MHEMNASRKSFSKTLSNNKLFGAEKKCVERKRRERNLICFNLYATTFEAAASPIVECLSTANENTSHLVKFKCV